MLRDHILKEAGRRLPGRPREPQHRGVASGRGRPRQGRQHSVPAGRLTRPESGVRCVPRGSAGSAAAVVAGVGGQDLLPVSSGMQETRVEHGGEVVE